MIATIKTNGKNLKIDLSKPIDISIPLREGKKNVNSFFLEPMKLEPFRMGSFVGDVNQGGACNVNNIFFNPHGNGTHTECVGHISKEKFTINQCLKKFFFLAQVVSIKPKKLPNGDSVITAEQIANCKLQKVNAIIIRTLPNQNSKMNRQYSGTNPTYIHHKAMELIQKKGIEHFLIDTPSVDREDDGGKLLAHHSFWNYPKNTRKNSTITEMIYVPNKIKDGIYLLNIQIASFENDASPSKPILYKII